MPLPHRLLSVSLLTVAGLLTGCFGSSDLTQATLEEEGALPPEHPEVAVEPEDACSGFVLDPGRVTLHRLNRVEYDNTVHDLLGDTTGPAKDFPADDRGYGYDNNADVLSMSPLLMEKYDAAAERLVDEAWSRDFTPGQATRIEAEAATASTGASTNGGTAWNIHSNGTVSASVAFAVTGDYTFSVRAWGRQAGPEPVMMELRLDNTTVATFTVANTDAQTFQQTVAATAGTHTVAVAFINDYYDPDNVDPAQRDRNLMVDWFEVQRPGTSAGAGAKVRVCDLAAGGDACARDIIGTFARRAWRRAVTPGELDRLMGFAALALSSGDSLEVGVKLALQAVLLSPHFLFRVELDPDPSATDPHPLSDYELASRLSYFLWSTTPDDELLDLAEQGVLQNPAVLDQQVDRMLEDPRSEALVENFAGQWLETRAVEALEPNAEEFAGFSPELKADIRAETEAFFRAFLTEDLPVRAMLDADFTFLNDRLAAHYGLPAPGSEALVRVTLPAAAPRSGLLTQASFLSVTSHADRTSPVKRGKWVLEHLLCKAPPPPPPNVENLEATVTGNTLRERMEQHRADPTCAGCHSLMDPIGFGLENYDAVGRYREMDEGYPVDASGTLPGGEVFNGALELSQIIKGDPKLASCVARNMMVYALGRGDREEDTCALQQLGEAYEARGGTLRDLIHVLVRSELFTHRRGEPVGGNP